MYDKPRIGHSWSPIENVPDDHVRLSKPELHTLMGLWLEQKAELEERDTVKAFNQGLLRRWAVETGLIERLYTLDQGVTELLVERGLEATHIPHGGTNGDPEHVISLIRDQHTAVENLFDFVASRRPLSTSYIKELHALLTANQDRAEAIDSLGRRVTVPLRKGAYKLRPNNPRLVDGSIHEYCPPEQVESEMDRLIEMHVAHDDDHVAPEVQSAWLHHRFAQIHPFQDGNGRVARTLATLVMLRCGWLPLVVTNDRRSVYLDTLREADRGSLRGLVDLFSRIQKRAFLQALSVAEEVRRQDQREDHVIAAMRDDFERHTESLHQEWETAKDTAQALQSETVKRLEALKAKLTSTLRPLVPPDREFRFFVDSSTSDKAHWFRFQLVETAKTLGYWANLREYHTWTRLVGQIGTRTEILLSFHGLGHEFRGVLVGSACYFEKDAAGDYAAPIRPVPLTEDAFQFNYREPVAEVRERFGDWIAPVLVRGLESMRRSW